MLKDYHWYKNGLSVIGGDLLQLYQSIDRLIVSWATGEYGAKEYLFPTFISVEELNKIDYFRSFPHLATFPICLSSEQQNLQRFIAGQPLSLSEEIKLTDTESVREVLTPAACYHVYIYLQGKELQSPTYITTVNNCFRREKYYRPFQRQWNFHMREIICLGKSEDVETFLTKISEKVNYFCCKIGLSIEWDTATDPFFQPDTNPKYIAQVVHPTKREMLFNKLSLGSSNFHRDYFGKNFQISMQGETVYTACIAFGLERWL